MQNEYVLAYHGTNSPVDFDVFQYTEDIGFHFGSIEAANKRLVDIADESEEEMEFMRIIPCVLSIKNPLRINDCFTWGVHDVLHSLLKSSVISEDQYSDLSASGYLDQEMMKDLLSQKGFDSVVYENITEAGGDSFIVFDPDLIDFSISPSKKLSTRKALKM